MPDHDLAFASAIETRERLRGGEVTATEAVSAALARAKRLNPELNAIVAFREEQALEEAARIDAGHVADGAAPLLGVPVTVKDTNETLDMPMTMGSRALRDNHTGFDAEVIARIRQAGAVVIGKTNVPEFALRPTTENLFQGTSNNPWNREYNTGGSTGGGAASVAAGIVPLTQGNDGGGSIRIPAACNGLVGIKPSRGRIPWGPTTYESWAGLSTNGPLARTVRDAALLLEVMSGPMVGDPYAVAVGATDFLAACDRELAARRIAYCTVPPHGEVTADVLQPFLGALPAFADMGHSVQEATPDLTGLYDPFMTILAGNAGALRYAVPDDRLGDLEGSTLSLMVRGAALTAAEYCRAVDVARTTSARIMRCWSDFDFLLTPTITRLPPRNGTMPAIYDLDGRWDEYQNWQPFMYVFNLTGQPALSIPCGWDEATGLPVGMQIVGRMGQEAEMLALAAAFEARRPWTDRRPAL